MNRAETDLAHKSTVDFSQYGLGSQVARTGVGALGGDECVNDC